MEGTFERIKCAVDISFSENFVGGDMDCVHYHDAYEIYILERGSRNYIINDKLVELEQRDVALVNPYELHTTGGGRFRRYLISFKREFVDSLYTKEGAEQILRCFRCKKIHVGKANCERLITLLGELKNSGDNIFLFTEMMGILNSCADSSVNIPVSPKNLLMSQIIEYIAANYSKIEGIEEIAEKFFITRFYLCRLFKQNTGVSVIRYINSLKIQRACELLIETKKTLEEISAETGFNSSMYFCRVFKSTMDMTPSQYRKRAAVHK